MARKIVASLFVKTFDFLTISVHVFDGKNGWQRTQTIKKHPVHEHGSHKKLTKTRGVRRKQKLVNFDSYVHISQRVEVGLDGSSDEHNDHLRRNCAEYV